MGRDRCDSCVQLPVGPAGCRWNSRSGDGDSQTSSAGGSQDRGTCPRSRPRATKTPKRSAGARDPEAIVFDERLHALAAHIKAGSFFECPWQLFCYGQLKGLSDEEAVKTLAAWCKRQGFEMSFMTRQVGSVHAVYVVLKVKRRKR
jgi:hypothetical protein